MFLFLAYCAQNIQFCSDALRPFYAKYCYYSACSDRAAAIWHFRLREVTPNAPATHHSSKWFPEHTQYSSSKEPPQQSRKVCTVVKESKGEKRGRVQ